MEDIISTNPTVLMELPREDVLPNNPSIQPFNIPNQPKTRTNLRILAILTALYLSLFIAALDQTIISTSIPTITAALHSASGYFWIGGAYLLANAASSPVWAKGSDIWGRKPALLGSVALFAISSIIAALSSSMKMLIAARALQGVAGGGLIQLVHITISDLFSLRRRALWLGMVELVWALAGSIGPLVGGAFTQFVSWRWCFWLNLPFCCISLVLLCLFLDVHNPKTKLGDGLRAIDWCGTLAILAVTLMLLLGLDFGGATFPWNSPKVISLMVFATLIIGFFVFSEKRLAKYPLMPLGMFGDRSNNAAFLVTFAHGMVFIGLEYYVPLYLQSVKQASPIRSGVLVLPITLSTALMGIVVGVSIHQTGRYREIIWAGVTLLTFGTGLYTHWGTGTSIAEIVGFEVIGGIGSGLLFEGPLIAVQSTVHQADTASATATFGFIRGIALSMSVVLGGVVFQNGMNTRRPFLEAAGLSQSVLDALAGDKAAANVDIVKTIQDAVQQQAVEEAFAWSMRDMFIMYTCVAGMALVASLFVRQRHLSTEHTETKTGLHQIGEGAP